jgi:hypothetical protein
MAARISGHRIHSAAIDELGGQSHVTAHQRDYLTPWLRHIGTSPPSLHLAIAPDWNRLDRDIMRPALALAGDRRAQYNPGGSAAVIYGRRIGLVVACLARSEARLRGMCPWAVLVIDDHEISGSFLTMILSRMSRPGSRVFTAVSR